MIKRFEIKNAAEKYFITVARFAGMAILIIIFAFLISFPAEASFEMSPVSAQLLGRGGWSVADDRLSSLDNSAVTSEVFNWEAGRANYYGISELNGGFLSLQIPAKTNSFNFIYSTLKFSSVYQESVYSFALAKNLTKNLNAGLRLNTYRIDIAEFEEGLNTSTMYSNYDFALLREGQYFNFGVSFKQLASKDVTLKSIPERNSQEICYGIMVKPVKGAKLGLDYEFGKPLAAGVEVEVADALKCAIGIRKNMFTLGFSLRMPGCRLHFSTLLHSEMGETYFISISGK
ncbi:hypothetical protein KJ633_08970 [bacterium]|nr:hypothetical protein [bacterium]MBU3956577.1 hypothetical protein [bacterium]